MKRYFDNYPSSSSIVLEIERSILFSSLRTDGEELRVSHLSRILLNILLFKGTLYILRYINICISYYNTYTLR